MFCEERFTPVDLLWEVPLLYVVLYPLLVEVPLLIVLDLDGLFERLIVEPLRMGVDDLRTPELFLFVELRLTPL